MRMMNPDHKQILIVDDDEKLATLLQESLRTLGEGYHVVTARGTDEALARVSRRSFDLVITDLMMPEVDGLQLLEALKAINPSIITVAMTAFDSTEIRAEAERFGIYRYLTKPFSVHEFRQCVIDAFEEAEQIQETTAFSEEQLKAIESNLSSLRTSVRAHSVALINSVGGIISIQSVERGLDMTSLCSALVMGNRAIAAEMTSLLGGQPTFRISYHEGDDYNVCVYTLNQDFSLVIVFGQGVKVGQVWFYAKRGVGDLRLSLPDDDPMDEVEEGGLETLDLEAEGTEGTDEPEGADVGDQAAADSWEVVAEEVARDFGGISLAEAQAMGLVGENLGESLDDEDE
jgi:CheY-like chemotaxis protein/predicted regulator of Ras-like GTPase activity (Roadblock/LC7/MglB family)